MAEKLDKQSALAAILREVLEEDLPLFFAHQQEPEALYMAAFTPKEPANWEAFLAHWSRLLADATILARTIVVAGQVVGHVGSFAEAGRREVTYWLGRAYWGRGLATQALQAFLEVEQTRPLYARVVKDNGGSLRVLDKCGFTVVGEDRGFANARGEHVEEYILELRR